MNIDRLIELLIEARGKIGFDVAVYAVPSGNRDDAGQSLDIESVSVNVESGLAFGFGPIIEIEVTDP